jgi:hypothetical protein
LTTRLERISLLGGALAGLLWVVSVFVLEAGGNPADPDTAADVVAHFEDNRTPILVAGTIHALGGFVFLWFLAALRPVLRRLPGETDFLSSAAFAAGIAAAALMLALMGPQTTGATTDVELLDPGAAVAFWRLAHVFFVAAEIAFAAFVLALSLLALRGVLLPRWLGWAGIAIAVILLVPPVGWLALLFLLPLWLVGVSAVLFLRSRPLAGAPEAPIS